MASVGSVLNSINSSLLAEIQSFSTPPANAGPAASGANTTDRVNFSRVSQLFQQLQQLQTSNPAEFKQVLTDAATKLQTAASQQTDPNAVAFLNNLAARFLTAADTGNLAALHPQSPQGAGGAQGHGGRHNGGGDNDANGGPSTSQTNQTSASPQTGAPSSALSNFLTLLNQLNAQTQQNPLNSSSTQIGQGGTATTSALIQIFSASLTSNRNSSTLQIQSLLASFVTSSSGTAA